MFVTVLAAWIFAARIGHMPDGNVMDTLVSPPTVSMTKTCVPEFVKDSHAEPDGSGCVSDGVIARA
jgi:hypothetical protein